ncbi:MAG: hypothetical protein PW786_03955 [Arachidicoccus sp.]|nr:hypothetical protein [Arachidicoccus sp.]
MKKTSLVLFIIFLSIEGFSQFKVGKTQQEVKSDQAKVTPVLIGSKRVALTLSFGLYHIDADNSEYLGYHSNINSFEKIEFASAQEELDFYNYVLSLYDNFKDNELTLNKIKIVPSRNNLLGANNLVFDIYPEPNNKSYKYTTEMIGRKAWIKLFEKSRIHSLK